jgi:hypothetical protein
MRILKTRVARLPGGRWGGGGVGCEGSDPNRLRPSPWRTEGPPRDGEHVPACHMRALAGRRGVRPPMGRDRGSKVSKSSKSDPNRVGSAAAVALAPRGHPPRVGTCTRITHACADAVARWQAAHGGNIKAGTSPKSDPYRVANAAADVRCAREMVRLRLVVIHYVCGGRV